jgi:hypothetical protein
VQSVGNKLPVSKGKVLREIVLVLREIWHCIVGTTFLPPANPMFKNILYNFKDFTIPLTVQTIVQGGLFL